MDLSGQLSNLSERLIELLGFSEAGQGSRADGRSPARGSERNFAMARNGDRPLGGRAAPDVVSRSVPDALAAVLD